MSVAQRGNHFDDLFRLDEDMRLVGEASDGASIVQLAQDMLADVVLLDISMPGPGFAAVIRTLKKSVPDWRSWSCPPNPPANTPCGCSGREPQAT